MPSLAEVYEAYREDPAFSHMRQDDRPLIPGRGSLAPKVLIVGEAPGATENVQGKPFVGASGAALRSLIEDVAELWPEDYFITNVVKYWPGPGNRTPEGSEIMASIPHLRAEYKALGSPPVLMALGGVALMALRPEGETRGILSCAGEKITLPGGRAVLWPMTHPAYALRNRDYRETMEYHWEMFGDWYRRAFK
jgi:uracil-DNA glycosylase